MTTTNLDPSRLDQLSDAELHDLKRALHPRLNHYIPITPHPKQAAFLLLNDVLEVLFGGAAGPGKSTAVLAAAAQYVDVPNYSALILRRTYTQLSKQGALLAKSHEWWDHTDAKYNAERHTWTFPSGATIEFGYLENDKHLANYQSAEYQFIGFDELTQFPKHHYTYMFSRLRRLEGYPVPIRMRGATNPGGLGHSWVKERWSLPHGPKGVKNRAFVPGRLEDNPSLDAANYEIALEELGELTYRQLREGDWDAEGTGGFFDVGNFTMVSPEEVPYLRQNVPVRFWDLAASDPTEEEPDPDWSAGLRMMRSPLAPDWVREKVAKEGHNPQGPYWYIQDVNRIRRSTGHVYDRLEWVARRDGISVPVWVEQERGGAGKAVVNTIRDDVLPGHTVRGLQPKGSKETRAKTVAGRSREGKILVVTNGDWVEDFMTELGLFGMKDVHDDQVDALSGAFEATRREKVMTEHERAIQH